MPRLWEGLKAIRVFGRAPLGEQGRQLAAPDQSRELGVAADGPIADEDLRHGMLASDFREPTPAFQVVGYVNLSKGDFLSLEQARSSHAITAEASSIDGDFLLHSFTRGEPGSGSSEAPPRAPGN